MKSIIVLEKMIKELESRISAAKSQLSRHNSGEEILTLFAQSSAENNLDVNVPLVNKYREIMKEFQKYDTLSADEHERFKIAIERKKYYKFNKQDNCRLKYKENDEKIEAVMILDELSEELIVDKKELFDLSFRNIEQYMIVPPEEKENLEKIQNEFENLIKGFSSENIKDIELLNYMIPIVVLNFHIFMINIKNHKNAIEINQIVDLGFFPKYHDWWISEMWTSHIAYFALNRWKNTISELCVTENQKKVWEIIFSNWIFVKTLLTEKFATAFEYQYIVDSLIYNYVKLSSELDVSIVKKAKIEIEDSIRNEDLFLLEKEHNVITPYIDYKLSN